MVVVMSVSLLDGRAVRGRSRRWRVRRVRLRHRDERKPGVAHLLQQAVQGGLVGRRGPRMSVVPSLSRVRVRPSNQAAHRPARCPLSRISYRPDPSGLPGDAAFRSCPEGRSGGGEKAITRCGDRGGDLRQPAGRFRSRSDPCVRAGPSSSARRTAARRCSRRAWRRCSWCACAPCSATRRARGRSPDRSGRSPSRRSTSSSRSLSGSTRPCAAVGDAFWSVPRGGQQPTYVGRGDAVPSRPPPAVASSGHPRRRRRGRSPPARPASARGAAATSAASASPRSWCASACSTRISMTLPVRPPASAASQEALQETRRPRRANRLAASRMPWPA